MNNNFIQKLKDWWHENGRVVKAGFCFGVLGAAYGVFEGYTMANETWLKNSYDHIVIDAGKQAGTLALTEASANPDMLIIVGQFKENS